MASTFTGLKLQGELGRFGTTEISDIAGKYGFVRPFPTVYLYFYFAIHLHIARQIGRTVKNIYYSTELSYPIRFLFRSLSDVLLC